MSKQGDNIPVQMQDALYALSTRVADTLVPLAPGTILSSASVQLARQIADMVPEGKQGAAMTIVDKDGIRLGLAATYKGLVTVTLDVQQSWAKRPPTASLKVKAVWGFYLTCLHVAPSTMQEMFAWLTS